jgi:hypothetical protein
VFGLRDQALVKAIVARLVAAKEQHGVAPGIEDVENAQRAAAALNAPLAKRIAGPSQGSAKGKRECDAEHFKTVDAASNRPGISIIEATVPIAELIGGYNLTHHLTSIMRVLHMLSRHNLTVSSGASTVEQAMLSTGDRPCADR